MYLFNIKKHWLTPVISIDKIISNKKINKSNTRMTKTQQQNPFPLINKYRKNPTEIPVDFQYKNYLKMLDLFDKNEMEKCQEEIVEILKKEQNDFVLSRSVFYFYYLQEIGFSASFEPNFNSLNFPLTNNSQINCKLHYLIKNNSYKAAHKLLINSNFNLKITTNNQSARYFYYKGKINSIILDYSNSYSDLLMAKRKLGALTEFNKGFMDCIDKLLIVVQLLLGEIPEKTVFINGFNSYLNITRGLIV